MVPRRSQYYLLDLVLWVTLAGLCFGFARWSWRMVQYEELAVSSFVIYPIGFIVLFVVWALVHAKRTAPACRQCGQRYLPDGRKPNLHLCPRCRIATRGPTELRAEQTRGCLGFLLAIALLAIPIVLALRNAIGDRSGWSQPLLVSSLTLATTIGLLAMFCVVAVIISFIRNRRMRVEKYAFASARKCARHEGTIDRAGPMTVWWCGEIDPVPVLLRQMETTRRRFEELIGEPFETPPPVRVLVFEKRSAFLSYHRNVVAYLGQRDCVYSTRPARELSLTTEVTRYRLSNVEESIRSHFALYFVEARKGFFPASWIIAGITASLATESGGDRCKQLTRRMKVALARGTAIDAAELFSVSSRELLKQTRVLADRATFVKFTQLVSQCWSLVEYLAGADAPADRAGRFRSFLSDLRSTDSQEQLFTHHFGYGFGPLLEEWRAWVQEQDPGSYSVPQPKIRAAILERLVPTICDQSEGAQARVQAIRELGVAGYAVGADTLVQLLRDGDDRLAEEAVWSLESISGLALGRDADRWDDWWSGLDPTAVDTADPAEPRI